MDSFEQELPAQSASRSIKRRVPGKRSVASASAVPPAVEAPAASGGGEDGGSESSGGCNVGGGGGGTASCAARSGGLSSYSGGAAVCPAGNSRWLRPLMTGAAVDSDDDALAARALANLSLRALAAAQHNSQQHSLHFHGNQQHHLAESDSADPTAVLNRRPRGRHKQQQQHPRPMLVDAVAAAAAGRPRPPRKRKKATTAGPSSPEEDEDVGGGYADVPAHEQQLLDVRMASASWHQRDSRESSPDSSGIGCGASAAAGSRGDRGACSGAEADDEGSGIDGETSAFEGGVGGPDTDDVDDAFDRCGLLTAAAAASSTASLVTSVASVSAAASAAASPAAWLLPPSSLLRSQHHRPVRAAVHRQFPIASASTSSDRKLVEAAAAVHLEASDADSSLSPLTEALPPPPPPPGDDRRGKRLVASKSHLMMSKRRKFHPCTATSTTSDPDEDMKPALPE